MSREADAAALAPPRRRPSPALARTLIVLALIPAWEFGARLFGHPAFFTPLTDIAAAMQAKILGDPKVVNAIMLTFWELAVAFAMSVGAGLAIGVALGLNRIARNGMYPIVLLLYAIPQVTVLPLFVLMFGLGPPSKVAFGVSHGVFPIVVNVLAGMRNISELYLQGARSMGATRAQILRHVVFPHMVPSFFAGMRLAMTATLLGVLLAELYVSTGGIGYYTQLFAETFSPSPLFALISVLAAMAIVLNETVRRAERRFARWKE